MTNTLAVILGLVVVGGIAADLSYFDGQYLLFLGRKLAQLIEWLAFWR